MVSSRSIPCALAAVLGLACCGPFELDLGGSELGEPACAGPVVPISRVQGAESESPLADQRVAVAGIVTLAQPGTGFYLQSELFDADSETSEGLFVRAERAQVSPGERVVVRGRARELRGATELDAVDLIQSCGRAEPEAVEALFDGSELERWEHMWVTRREPWTLVDAADFARGELLLSPTGRRYAAGHVLGTAEGLSGVWPLRVLEDTSHAPSAPRLGSRAESFGALVQLGAGGPALLAERAPSWRQPGAPQPEPPAGEQLRVTSLNLQNYFAEPGVRGARSLEELERQRTKLVAALSALHADILALVELGSSAASLEHLAAGLNAGRAPAQRFVWSAVEAPGTSPIRAALLYRADRVEAASEAWFEPGAAFTRPPLFQRFRRASAALTIGVVHLKSKRCDGEVPLDEVEGCGAQVRRAEAGELVRLAGLLPSGPAAPVLLIGDFNADSREAPLAALAQAGWVDLLDAVPAPDRYSYVFEARATLLDHALANAELARGFASAAIWHVNADEPATRGYSLANPGDQYAPDARRSSDHDPISVDLRL